MKVATRAPLGGLVTKVPPMLLQREQSPDLLNVLMGDGSVDSRGGFAPLFKDRMLMNSVRNAGYHATSRLSTDALSTDGNFLTVPGCLTAGHRAIYETSNGLGFDLFFEVGDLTSQHGGNGITGGGVVFDGAPYTIKVRPIFSKGPVKRSQDTAVTGLSNADIAWNTTASTVWGNHSESGMPFCLYLYNNGTGTAPAWQFRLSGHALLVAGPAWSLQTATSTVPVVAGGRYHIIGVITNTRVYLRIARIVTGQTPSYTGNETTFIASAIGWNKCPFQVFDCPQQFTDATVTGSATQRPGLGYATGTATGAYWFACKRAEGRIEDIAVWLGSPLGLSNSELDRSAKLDQANTFTSQLANYWNMLLPGTDYVQDATGRSNHLYFVPRGPVCDKHSGGKDGQSWFFNGQTSYALIDVGSETAARDNPNWNFYSAGTLGAAMRGLVLNNLAHGIQVELWVDAIEPQYQQVIAEIHGALRLAINASGKLVGYCRSGGGANGQLHGQLYQGPVTGTATLVPGQRYIVTLMRRAGGTDLDLYVDGVLDATVGSLNAATTASGRPVSGVTLGMGSWQIMTRGSSTTSAGIAAPNQVNTDSRSGFVGRIESFAIVTSPNGATLAPNYKTQERPDWDFSESRVMQNPVAAARDALQPTDAADTIRSVGGGAIVQVAGQEEGGQPVRLAVLDSATSPQVYSLHNTTLTNANAATGTFGHLTLTAVGVRISHCLAYYRLQTDDRDTLYGGAYVAGLEYRYSGSTVTTENQARNANKAVHVQFSAETDQAESLGAVQRRCVESDAISETENSITTQPAQYTHRQRPYAFRSPLELGPRWAVGMVRPLPGQAEVTLVQDWEVQAGGRRFIIAACGRQLYWAKPLWEPDSPFAEAAPQSVFLAGLGHVFVKATAATMSFDYAARGVAFEGWVKPFRLDGRRVLFAKMTPGTSTSQINWMAYVEDGSLIVLGTEGSGARTWSYCEGTIPASGAFVRKTQTLRVGAWNHVRIVLGSGLSNPGLTAVINGHAVAMADLNSLTGALRTDALGAGATDTPSGELYVGGLPDGVVPSYSVTVSSVAGTALPLLSWYGLLSELRFAPSAATVSGYVPRARFSASANTTLLHLNEGSGWRLTNSGTSATDHAHSQVTEFLMIAEGLEESTGHRYSALSYRDSLLVSNGESRVQQVRFSALTAQTPLKVNQLGMLPPTPVDAHLTATSGAGAGIAAATYRVSMTFVDIDGRESDPDVLGDYVLGGDVASLTFVILNLPRSHDPQVVARQLYVSAPGGGVPIVNRTLFENDSYTHEVSVIIGATGVAATPGERLVPRRGRQLAVAGANLVVADLPEFPAGQNALQFSRGDEPSYFTNQSDVVIDSQDGKPLIGIRGLLSQVYLSKRDSLYQLAVGALVTGTNVQAAIRLTQSSDAVGGGHAAANNLIYGAGDRGVFGFNGTALAYFSEQIEPTWRNEVDRTDLGLSRMFGAFLREQSQYWLSIRRQGTLKNDTILVLELVGAPAWSRLLVPEHSCLAAVADPETQVPTIVIGTTSGAVLRSQNTTSMDWSDDAPNGYGAITLDATAALVPASDTLSLQVTGANFDTVLGGMAGAPVTIVCSVNGELVTYVRSILSNTRDTLRWTTAVAGLVAVVSISIGGFDAYWTNPWVADTAPNREQTLNRIGLEMVPRVGNLTLRVASIRQGESPLATFPTTATKYEEFTVAMDNGWLDDMRQPKEHSRGHYHRIRVGTSGIRKPFGLIGYELEIVEAKATSHAGAR